MCEVCHVSFPLVDGVPDMLSPIALDNRKNIEAWREKLKRQEYWWHHERGQPQSADIEKSWRPSPNIMLKYFQLAEVNGNNGRVLDIGCGEGRRSRHFGEKEYYGIDPLILRCDYPFPFYRGIGEALPFADSVFDVVISVEALDHVVDPEVCLGEACRVLREGGSLFIFVGLPRKQLQSATIQARDTTFNTTETDVHLHEFTAEKFKCVLEGWHFDKIEIDTEEGYLAVCSWNLHKAQE